MEQLVLLLIIGLISFINWLMQRSAKMREQRKLERSGEPAEQPVEFEDDQRQEDPEESMRKLMEALGIPQEESPPPPVPAPPPIPQRQEPAYQSAFVPEVVSPAIPHPRTSFSVPKARQSLKRSLAAVVETREPSRFRTMISTQSGLRDAIVLAEVLGPPQSLKR